jgi:hypothetical protein
MTRFCDDCVNHICAILYRCERARDSRLKPVGPRRETGSVALATKAAVPKAIARKEDQ